MTKEKEIRAVFDNETITIYQAYKREIALAAIKAQTFVFPFKTERMTWIKPSFLWMMYRSGWATKDGQEHILAIKIKREGFEWALKNACLSHFEKNLYIEHENWKKTINDAPVRVQWDPEKNLTLNNLNYKSIQIGLKDEAVKRYLKDWIVQIDDITDICKNIHALIIENKIEQAKDLIPKEKIYPLLDNIKLIINAN